MIEPTKRKREMEDMYDDSGSFDITSDDAVVGDFSKNVVERAAAAKFTIEQYYHNFFRSEKEREGRYGSSMSCCL